MEQAFEAALWGSIDRHRSLSQYVFNTIERINRDIVGNIPRSDDTSAADRAEG